MTIHPIDLERRFALFDQVAVLPSAGRASPNTSPALARPSQLQLERWLAAAA